MSSPGVGAISYKQTVVSQRGNCRLEVCPVEAEAEQPGSGAAEAGMVLKGDCPLSWVGE